MKTILFLDIDGVLSIPNLKDSDERREKWDGCGICWPIPMAYHLLRAIETDPQIYPVWMSTWDTGALEWNSRSGTAPFPVAYHLSRHATSLALLTFPECRGQDSKLLAVRWFLRNYPTHPVVWIEDGFAEETRDWADGDGRVRLIDTWPMDSEIALFLQEHHADLKKASLDVIQRFLLDEKAFDIK